MVRRGDNIEVPGKGTPVYYINDKKVQSFQEVERLLVKDIKSVTLISNPGANYDAGGRAVVLIKTKRIREGIMAQANLHGALSKEFSHDESLNLSYKSRKMSVFTSYKYNLSKWNESGNSEDTILADTLWSVSRSYKSEDNTASHSYQAGLDYDIAPNQFAGIKYDGVYSSTKDHTHSAAALSAGGEPHIGLVSQGRSVNTVRNHHLNFYYHAKWKEVWQLKVYADYVSRVNKTIDSKEETDSQSGQKEVCSDARSDWNIYALNASLRYAAGKAGSFQVGFNTSWVKGFNEVINVNALTSGNYGNRELKTSSYFMYEYAGKSFSLNAGIKYEHLLSETENRLQPSRRKIHYNNWLPSFSGMWQSGKFTHSFSYAYHMERPSYHLMNENVYYRDRFGYSKGNADLKPASLNEFEYRLFYNYFYFSLSYLYKTNQIESVYYSEPANSSVVISTQENYNKYHELKAVAYYSRTVKWWEPTVSLLCLKSFFRYPTVEGMQKTKMPVIRGYLDNSFNLPKDFRLSFDLSFWLAGDYLMLHTSPVFTVNAGLQKSFLKKNLQLTLKVFDLFDGEQTKGSLRVNNYRTNSYLKLDSRKVELSLVYRFNRYTKKYRGESAAGDEMNRLGVGE